MKRIDFHFPLYFVCRYRWWWWWWWCCSRSPTLLEQTQYTNPHPHHIVLCIFYIRILAKFKWVAFPANVIDKIDSLAKVEFCRWHTPTHTYPQYGTCWNILLNHRKNDGAQPRTMDAALSSTMGNQTIKSKFLVYINRQRHTHSHSHTLPHTETHMENQNHHTNRKLYSIFGYKNTVFESAHIYRAYGVMHD